MMKRKDFRTSKTFDGTFQIMSVEHGDDAVELLGENDEEYKRYQIRIYGLTMGGMTVRVDVNNFNPYFYLKVPDNFGKKEMSLIINHIKKDYRIFRKKYNPQTKESEIMYDYTPNILTDKFKLIKREQLIGFTNHKEFKFIKLVFNNQTVMKQVSRIFDKSVEINGCRDASAKRGQGGSIKYELYESNIEPYIRFFHERNIKPSSWVKLGKYSKLNAKNLTVMKYYKLDSYKQIYHHESKAIAPFMTMAFDIECYSSTGGFPKPNLDGDEVIMIGSTFRKYPDKKSCRKVIHTLKKSKPIEGCEIIYCKDEAELLLSWRDMVQEMDPEFIYGYNSNGFDFEYIYERAYKRRLADKKNIKNKRKQKFMHLSRDKTQICEYKEIPLSSSALGQNIHKIIIMNGRIIIDVMKEIQKEHKLDMYKLDHVAEHFTGEKKVDLSPQQLFEKYRSGKKSEIREIGVYCLQDTELCHTLQFKLNTIIKAMKMSNVCYTPLSYIFYRGQGVKIFSLISKNCRDRRMLIPLIKKPYGLSDEEKEIQKAKEAYDGALVIPTDGGLYYDPIVVLDFNSLYPSCQIAWNLSHDTIVTDPKYLNLPGFKYETIKYQKYKLGTVYGKSGKPLKKKANIPDGEVSCTFVQLDDPKSTENKGIIPMSVKTLLDTRKEIKKELKKVEYGSEEYMLLDCEQLAYKLVANSIYGQCGAGTSPIYYKHVAACTTSKGREMLQKAKDVAITNYKDVDCIYGDSVPGYTPVMVRDPITNIIKFKRIEDLIYSNVEWSNDYKGLFNNKYKEFSTLTSYEVWTDDGWAKINKVIRHKTPKTLYRVMTNNGLVDVTEDHSLLDNNCNEIKPDKCIIGKTSLLHSYPSEFPSFKELIISDIDPYTQGNIHSGTDESISNEIMFGDYDVRYLYLHGYAYHNYVEYKEPFVIYNKTQKKASELYYLAKSVGYDVEIESDYTLNIMRTKKSTRVGSFVKNIIDLGTTSRSSYVYDLETSKSRFQAGIGNIIVKNTDSNFYKVNGLLQKVPEEIKKLGPDATKKEIIKMAIARGHEMSETINKAINKLGVINFAYEKTLLPFIIITKKRYYGRLYENDPEKYINKVMGLAIVRRNYCAYVKEIQKTLLNMLMEEYDINVQKVKDFIKDRLTRLVNQEVPLKDLVISASLKDEYKNPTGTVHWVVAQEMKARGETVNSNDRIAYAYAMHQPEYNTLGRPKKPKIVDVAMEYKHMVETYKQYDPEIYITNQIYEPISQILNLAFGKDECKKIFDDAIARSQQKKIEIYGSPVIPTRGKNNKK